MEHNDHNDMMRYARSHDVKALMLESGRTLYDFFKNLERDESIILELPNGETRKYTYYSFLSESDRALPIATPGAYDTLTGTYYLKMLPKEDNTKDIIKRALNSVYGINSIHHEFNKLFKVCCDLEIKKVIYNGPATIIFWDDGTKTVVKAQEEIDHEKGILYAAIKKFTTKKEYNDILRAIDKEDEACKDDPVKLIRDNLFPDRPIPPEEMRDFLSKHVVEKPKKKVYKRHFGDSNQRCPYCGQNWIWSGKRRISFYHDGFIKFTCKNCGRKIIYTKEGKYA